MNEIEIVFVILILTAAFSLMVLGAYFVRRRDRLPRLRPIAAYEAMKLHIDEAIESDRKIHISLGASSIGNETTLTALASTEIVYYLLRRQAFIPKMPLLTLSDPITLAVAQDTVRKAYIARNNALAYRGNAVLWYPQSERSLAFGVGISALAAAEKSPASILLGTFGNEIAFVGEMAQRQQHGFVGQSTQLEGQAIAFMQSKTPLIGEELFVGDAYLSDERSGSFGGVLALDVLRWVIAAIIVTAVVINLLDS